MVTDKRLYRSRDSLIGGVCAGIAEYFDIDPIIVRILAAVFAIASLGMFILIYVMLWIILPLAPDANKPVDVQPESVHSETYGPVSYQDYEAREKERSSTQAASQVAAGYASTVGYTGAGHVPPEPPTTYAPQQSEPIPAEHIPYQTYNPSQTYVPSAAVPPMTNEPVVAEPVSGKSVRAALWFGFSCLAIGLSALLGHFIEGVSWWQFWPLFIVIIGIGKIVIPARRGHRMEQFVSGLMMLATGGVLLLMSLDAISFRSIEPMIRNLWPLLIMMTGFFILAGALRNPILRLCGGLCFVAFCIVGLIWFSLPGSVDFIVLDVPFREALMIDVRPWER
ncbi:MAG: PspC domain-containing protein [Raoultibacter sp.]